MSSGRLNGVLLLLALAGCGGSPAGTSLTSGTTPPVATVQPSAVAPTAPTIARASSTPTQPVPATATGSLLDACLSNDLTATPVAIADSNRAPLEAALVGAGTVGVVLSNQNDNDVCPWLPFARALRDDGYQVLLYRYGRAGAFPSADLAAAVDALRAQGVERIVLVGASIGAAATVVVASKNPPGVVAAVSLSAVSVADGRSITPNAEQLTLPTLFVTADRDGSGSSQAVPLLHGRAPAPEKQLLVVPGTAHGWQLLDDATVVEQVRAFLARYR